MTRHLVRRAAGLPEPSYDEHGYRRRELVGEGDGSSHTGFGVCELRPEGAVAAHVHSYEESFHVLHGTVVLDVPEGSYLLEEGDYGLLPTGVPHAWRGAG
ncbi:MAG: cupin domain-containing protein, partial [Streptomyces sp.]